MVQTHTHTTHICKHTHICAYRYTHTHIPTHMCAFTQTHTYVCTHTNSHICMHAHPCQNCVFNSQSGPELRNQITDVQKMFLTKKIPSSHCIALGTRRITFIPQFKKCNVNDLAEILSRKVIYFCHIIYWVHYSKLLTPNCHLISTLCALCPVKTNSIPCNKESTYLGKLSTAAM